MKKYIVAVSLFAIPWVFNAATTVGDLTLDCDYASPNTTCNNSYNPLPKGVTGLFEGIANYGTIQSVVMTKLTLEGKAYTGGGFKVFVDETKTCGGATWPQDTTYTRGLCMEWLSTVPAGNYGLSYTVTFSEGSTWTSNWILGVNPVSKVAIPSVATRDGVVCPANSSINMDSLALNEAIPLVGVPFFLAYSSDRFQSWSGIKMKEMGLGGWSPSIVHRYDYTNKILYFGDGSIRPVEGKKVGTLYQIPDYSGRELYIFDSNGLHTQTKDTLTGIVKWTISYDASKKLISLKDRYANVTSFAYSASQILIKSPYNQVTTLATDTNGFLASVSNPAKEIFLIVTSSKGFISSFQKPGGQKSTVTYDSNGFVTKDQGAGGDFISLVRQVNATVDTQTTTKTSALGRKTVFVTSSKVGSSTHKVTYPDGSIETSSSNDTATNSFVDRFGGKGSSTAAADPRFGFLSGYSSKDSYVITGTPISVVNSKTKKSTLTNTSDPLTLVQLTETTIKQNDSTRTYTQTYDAAKRMWTARSPTNRMVYQTLNDKGNLGNIQVGSLSPVVFAYDVKGRVISMTQGDRISSMTYDAYGNVATVTNPLKQVVKNSYDAANRLVKRTLADGAVISYSYDKNGNLLSIVPAGKTSHAYSFNLFDKVSKYLPPALTSTTPGAIQYLYNTEKQVAQITQSDGSAVKFSYDGLGNVSLVEAPIGRYTYKYHPKSTMLASIISPGDINVDFDVVGNVVNTVRTGGVVSSTLQFTYNPDGSTATMGIAGRNGVVTSMPLAYDKDGLVIKYGSETVGRDNRGAIASTKVGNISSAAVFDKYGQVTSEKYLNGTTAIVQHAYTRDMLGRVTKSTVTKGTLATSTTYAYDVQGRVVNVNAGGKVYSYDANGNRTQVTNAAKVTKAKFDVQDRITNFGNIEYKYNLNGNLTSKIVHTFAFDNASFNSATDVKKTSSYVYDSFGNLRNVTLADGKKIEYVIDGLNRRIGKKVNGVLTQGFIYQSQTQIAAELDGNGNVLKQFVYASKMNVPDYMYYKGVYYRVVSNQVGTPEYLVNASTGAITESYNFDEYGVYAAGTSLLPFGFAGGLLDRDTGLVRLGARDYDPVSAKWMSKDPLQFSGNSNNLFSYSNGDPVNLLDFDGLSQAQMRMCMDGCSGTITDQFKSETSISIAEAQHNDKVVGAAGIAVAAVVAAPLVVESGLIGTAAINVSIAVDYYAIPMANLCAANPAACVEVTVGAAVTAAELIGDVSLGMDPGETGTKAGTITTACKKASEFWDYINE